MFLPTRFIRSSRTVPQVSFVIVALTRPSALCRKNTRSAVCFRLPLTPPQRVTGLGLPPRGRGAARNHSRTDLKVGFAAGCSQPDMATITDGADLAVRAPISLPTILLHRCRQHGQGARHRFPNWQSDQRLGSVFAVGCPFSVPSCPPGRSESPLDASNRIRGSATQLRA